MNSTKKRELEAKLREMLNNDNSKNEVQQAPSYQETTMTNVKVIRRRKGKPDKKIL